MIRGCLPVQGVLSTERVSRASQGDENRGATGGQREDVGGARERGRSLETSSQTQFARGIPSRSNLATRENGVLETIRVLVVEDHAIVREGVCTLLDMQPDIQVAGSVGSGEEALEFLRATEVDVVLMDLGLPGMSGIEATRKAKEDNPDVGVLALTMYTDDQYLLGMLDAGATGYLLKQSMVNDLVQAVRTVSDGHYFLHPTAAKTIVQSLRKPSESSSADDALTDREKDILRLVGQGCTSKEIARKLFLSPKTVENYRARILVKMQVRNCSEAVSRALRQGIIEPLS